VKLQTQGRADKRPRALLPMLALGAGLLALAGCGSGSSGKSTGSAATATPTTSTAPAASSTSTSAATSPGASQQLQLAANPEGQLKYDKTSLSANAGKVSIAFTNSSPIAHNVTIESSSGKTVGATPTFQGGTKTLSLNLKPGTYKFFCSVPGHRMAGMEGTLTVK
jgi:plastocyanin